MKRVFAGAVLAVTLLASAADAQTTTPAPAPPLTGNDQLTVDTEHFQIRMQHYNGHLISLSFGAPTTIRPFTPGPKGDNAAKYEEVYPTAGVEYVFEPALLAVHADGNTSTDLAYVQHTMQKLDDNRTETRISFKDRKYPLFVTLVFRAYRAQDIIEQWSEITHQESGPIVLQRFASSAPSFANTVGATLTHFVGEWAKEMHEVEDRLTPGMKVIDSKLGTRADYFHSKSFLLAPTAYDPPRPEAARPPVTETTGEVFGGTLEWSGSFQYAFEIENHRLRAVCGMNPYDSAYRLAAGKLFKTPAMLWGYSNAGKGQLSRNFHRWARMYALRNPTQTRPILLNNWEATGFDFNENRIVGLFDGARNLGVETFLLDDGWFANKYPRDNDKAGLGDWEVNTTKMPRGISYLVDEAKKRELRFGIWVEPEMVNPKSRLFEQHPDWAIQQADRTLDLFRNQLVLDLTRPEVKEFAFHIVDDLLTKNPEIAYVKWDCNRFITQPGSTYLKADEQQNLWIDYNWALYDIMERISQGHPKVQIMLCSGGGGRVDYGALRYFDSFWPSDNTDPLERVRMQYGYSLLFPAAVMSDHVTRMGNRPMKFCFDVAMSGALGLDMDLSKLSAADLKTAAAGIAVYKQIRDVVLFGDQYRFEAPTQGPRTSLMYLSADGSRAIVFAYQTAAGTAKPLALTGLAAARRYKVRELNLPENAKSQIAQDGQTLTGADLMGKGLDLPLKAQCDSAVVELTVAP